MISEFSVKAILDFDAPDESNPTGVDGEWIAQYLLEKLPEQGIATSNLDIYDDFAWSAECFVDGVKLLFIVGALESKQARWQLIVLSNYGLIQRLFGKDDNPTRVRLAKAIHNAFVADPRFSNLRWYGSYPSRKTGSLTPD